MESDESVSDEDILEEIEVEEEVMSLNGEDAQDLLSVMQQDGAIQEDQNAAQAQTNDLGIGAAPSTEVENASRMDSIQSPHHQTHPPSGQSIDGSILPSLTGEESTEHSAPPRFINIDCKTTRACKTPL